MKPLIAWIVHLMTLPALAATVSVTPLEVVRLALARNPALKSQDEVRRAATARRAQAEAGLRPQLDTRAQANHFEGLENQALGPVSIPVLDDQVSASIGVTQPLYTGGRVSRMKQGAQLGEEAARHAVDATASDLTLQTLTAYWQWSKGLAQAAALRDAVGRMEALVHDTRNLEKAGVTTDNDRLAAEVSLDQTQLQLDEAEHQAELSRIELSRLAGRTFTGSDSPLMPVLQPTDLALPDLDASLAAAHSNREDLASLRLNARATATLAEAARADRQPQVALVARYEQGRPNPRDFPPDTRWRDDAYIGAAVTWNLFDGGLTEGRVAEALARSVRDQFQYQMLDEAIAAQVRSAHATLRHALARLQTALHAETGARRNHEVAVDLWKNGTTRHSEVLEAQSRLTTITARRIAAEADILMAQAALNHATGREP